MKKTIISSIGLQAHDRLILQSLISLFKADSHDFWYSENDADANMLFIDTDTNNPIPSKKVHQTHILLSSNPLASNAELSLTTPLRAPSVRKTLLTLSQQITASSNPTTEHNHPEEHLAALLDLLVPEETRSATKISSIGCPTLVINRANKTVHINGELDHLQIYKSIKKTQLAQQRLSNDASIQAEAGLTLYPAERAFWLLGSTLSSNELLLNLRRFRTFSLKRWPDFGKLPHTSTAIKLASRLMMKPSSINDLMKSPAITQQDVIAFINACYLCNWLKPVDIDMSYHPSITATSSTRTARPQGLFSLLRAKLGIGA